MKTFTTYAEKKAKQILNLLQGYTKSIRLTAILILLLMGVNNAWGADITSDGSARLYFKMDAISWWIVQAKDGANYAYFFKSGTSSNAWSAKAVQYSDNTYYVVIPKGTWNNVILTRNSTAGAGWNEKLYNQTDDIELSNTSNYLSNFKSGNAGGSAAWGTAIKPASTGKLTASSTSVNIGTSVTLTPSLTSNNTINDINSTSYSISPNSGASISSGKFTATKAGTYTVTATITYNPDGYTSLTSTVEPTATITVIPWTITWDPNGGSVTPTSSEYDGATAVTLPTPTRDGYDFQGWYTAASGGTKINDIGSTTKPTSNVTYFAQWKARTYAITLNANGGASNGSATATYNSNSVTNATYPTRDHYECTGYYTATSGGTLVLNTDGTLAKNVSGYTDANGNWIKDDAATLHARWTINQYTINYGVCEESRHGDIQLNGGTKVTTSATSDKINHGTEVTFTATANNDHKIEGWYSNARCADKIQAAGTNSEYTFTLTENTTVYVKFAEAAEVMSQVTISATEGGSVNPSGTVEVGNKTSSTITATPAAGYRFDRWEVTGGVVAPQDLTTATINITATVAGTLTANFVRVYTVNFFATPAAAGSVTAKVGESPITSGATHDGNTIITFTATPTNNECNFIKWVDGAGNSSTDQTYEHTVTDDITIKAIFTINQYTLNFSAGEGGHVSATANNSAIASPATLDYNTSVTLTATPNANCAFAGWYEGSTKVSSNATYTINLTADKTLEARFTKPTTVYFKAIEYWKKDCPRYAIYYWGDGQNNNGWVDMTNVDCNGDIYEGYVPVGYNKFKFVRLAPSTTNDWANKWNETAELTTTNNANKMYIHPHIYLKPNSNWKSDGARFAARFYNDGGGEEWMSMNDNDGDGVYSCEILAGFSKVILCRMNGNEPDNNWGNKWNQTGDLNVPTNNNTLYTINKDSWDAGSWSAGPQKNGWQALTTPSYKLTYTQPANGTITVKNTSGTTIATGSTLNLDDEIKITFEPNSGYELINYHVDYASETETPSVYAVCGPTKITAEFAAVGTAQTVYLRPNEEWLRDEPIFAAYAYKKGVKDTEHDWYVMTTKADDYTGSYSCNISNQYDWVVFVRIKPNGRDNSDGTLDFKNAWNQTIDLQIMNNTPRFAIGEEKTVGDKQKYDGKWEENTPIWGMIANFNDWQAEKAIFMGYPGKLNTEPPFVPQHAFKLYNFIYAEGKYFGNSGTMQRANSKQWWTMNANEQANCQMKLDVKGDYIYQLRFLTVGPELRKQISVTYPADEVYALLYEYTIDSQTKSRMSYDIAAVAGEKLDTVSFHVLKDANPTIKLLKNSAAQGDAINISVQSDSVYNFVIQQSGGNASLVNAETPDVYTGKYYIRTDVAAGGWNNYKLDGNKMTYSSYADKNQSFDHYYCKWICNHSDNDHKDLRAYTNVKFCVANDYSHAISDELNGDEFIDKQGIAVGCLPEDGNVRFAWDSQTNELSRAYISGSGDSKDRFLVLTGNECLLDIAGNSIPVGTGDRAGLNKHELLFADKQNWIYQLDVQANNQTSISLTAEYNGKVQTFFGNAKSAAEGEPMLVDVANKYHKVRMIYDFKTNNLIAAWLLDETQYPETTSVASNMLIIRENQGVANQINFSNIDNDDMTIQTAYAVMTFTKNHVLGLEDKAGLSKQERTDYWVSFPFDVKISDVFGFGEYGDQWIMLLYDGEARAKEGYWAESKGFWKYITNRNYTLKAGVGYVLKLNPTKMKEQAYSNNATDASLFFPSQGITTIINAEPTSVVVPEHICTINRDTPKGDRRILDSNWNLIGVPGFANLADLNVEYPAASKKVTINNEAHNLSFYYAYDATTNSYNAEMAQETFKNMHAYMVQFAGTIDWKNDPLFNVPAELAARRNSDAELEKLTLRLEIAQGEEKADQTFVQMQQEGATAEFDMNVDMTKIINSGANIYTLVGTDRIQTAGNVLPFEETTVAVGVEIAAEGEYTFRMPEGTEGMVVELIDYETNTRTNLLLDDYTVTLPAGSNETRFALSMAPEKVATSIENTTTPSDSNIRKFIIDGKLYLQKDGMLYDAQGHIVR